jgi:hypothetical protein
VSRGELLLVVQLGEQVEVLVGVFERGLEVEEPRVLLRGGELACGALCIVLAPLLAQLLGTEQALHVAVGHGEPGP